MQKALTVLLLAAVAAPAHADTIEVGQLLPRIDLVKPGQHRYLRYIRDGAVNTPIDIWWREVRFEKDAAGKPVMRIVQRWEGAGKPASNRQLDSTFEPGTFRPYTHQRITEKDGARVVEGFVFSPAGVTGMQDLADNTQKALNVPTAEPTFNFETDMEMLQALPLADGYEARIRFYHPGGPAPALYTFKVAGSETIAGPAGPVECWVVTTDYNRPGSVAKFWFAKGTQQFVRHESTGPSGKVGVKTLIE
jgi:hypothetical protein